MVSGSHAARDTGSTGRGPGEGEGEATAGAAVPDAEVSVVLPTHERPDYLPGAVDTTRRQTLSPVEVVVVADPGAAYAAEAVADRPGVRLVEQPDRGIAAARNAGLAATDGEYVAFLDDDDRWHPAKLARQVRALRDGEAALANCLVAQVTPEGRPVRTDRDRAGGDLGRAILRSNVVGTASCVLVERDAVESVGGFDESFHTREDWELYVRLCQRYRVRTVREPLCYRTVHESLSSDAEAVVGDSRRLLEKHRELITRRGMWPAACAGRHTVAGRALLGAGKRRRARAHLREAMYRPTPRRALLYALTFAPSGFDRVVAAKRAVERAVGDPPAAPPGATERTDIG